MSASCIVPGEQTPRAAARAVEHLRPGFRPHAVFVHVDGQHHVRLPLDRHIHAALHVLPLLRHICRTGCVVTEIGVCPAGHQHRRAALRQALFHSQRYGEVDLFLPHAWNHGSARRRHSRRGRGQRESVRPSGCPRRYMMFPARETGMLRPSVFGEFESAQHPPVPYRQAALQKSAPAGCAMRNCGKRAIFLPRNPPPLSSLCRIRYGHVRSTPN